MSDDITYSTITRHAPGGRASVDWDGYALFHELLGAAMERAAEFGWLVDWPELPSPKLLKPEDPS
jgi:hypothetical protein